MDLFFWSYSHACGHHGAQYQRQRWAGPLAGQPDLSSIVKTRFRTKPLILSFCFALFSKICFQKASSLKTMSQQDSPRWTLKGKKSMVHSSTQYSWCWLICILYFDLPATGQVMTAINICQNNCILTSVLLSISSSQIRLQIPQGQMSADLWRGKDTASIYFVSLKK